MEVGGQSLVRFTSGKETGTHFTGGLLGPRVGLDGCGKFSLRRDSIPGPSSLWRVVIQTAITSPLKFCVREKILICSTAFRSVLGHVKPSIQLLKVLSCCCMKLTWKFHLVQSWKFLGEYLYGVTVEHMDDFTFVTLRRRGNCFSASYM